MLEINTSDFPCIYDYYIYSKIESLLNALR